MKIDLRGQSGFSILTHLADPGEGGPVPAAPMSQSQQDINAVQRLSSKIGLGEGGPG